MNDKQEKTMTLRESYAHAQLEDEAFDREFECCRKMKSAKPEPAPHPELLSPPKTLQSRCAKVDIPSYDNEWLRKKIKSSDDETSLRKERDDLKERCSDLDLQVDSLEAQLSKLKLENVTLKDTVIALKECESVKGQESEYVEWNGEGLPPVGCECECYDYDKVGYVRVKTLDAATGSKEMAVATIRDDGRFAKVFWGVNFRPMESPEQKAQREQEEAARELHDIYIKCLPGSGCDKNRWENTPEPIKNAYADFAKAIGYRKQP